jgi:hypothetical protein
MKSHAEFSVIVITCKWLLFIYGWTWLAVNVLTFCQQWRVKIIFYANESVEEHDAISQCEDPSSDSDDSVDLSQA